MMGQQKRLLQHIASSQPVKYQKHSDDKLCEAHTRVASLTGDKLEFEQHFSGVSQKNEFSVVPGSSCDSMKVFERVLASESRVLQREKDASEPDAGVSCSSREGSIISSDQEIVRMAEDPCSQRAKESSAQGREENMGHSFDRVNKTQFDGTVGVDHFIRGAEFSPLIGSGASTSEDGGRNNLVLSGSPPGDLTVELFGDEPIGLIQGPRCLSVPSTAKNNSEDGAFHGSVDSRSARCSQSLPVHMSEKVIDLYAMDEQVQSYGGYEVVTSEGLWGVISEALGLGTDCGPGLKLIYFKHLRDLGRDRRLLVDRHQESDLIDSVNLKGPTLPNHNGLLDDEKGENYSLTESEQFAESELLNDKLGEQPVKGRSSNVNREDPLDVDHSEVETGIVPVKRDYESAKFHSQYRTGGYPFMGDCSFSKECKNFPEAFHSDHRLLRGHPDHHSTSPAKQERDIVSNDEEHGVYDVATIERINKSLADTLIWIKRMAVEPGNPLVGQGPEGTGQNEKWAAERASQAKKVRALLWRRRDDVRPGDGHSHQAKRQIPPPSHYYEDSTRQEQQAPDRPRRERAAHHGSTSAQKPSNEATHFERNASPSFNQQPQWGGQTSQRLSRQSHHYYSEDRYFEEFIDRPRKRVPIGVDFQAHVPTFRSVDRHPGSISASGIAGHNGDETQSSDDNDEEDDSRWLGKQVWPPPGYKNSPHKNHNVGRTRPSFCLCSDPESQNCVRLHIEEERDFLKQQLGQAFYIWKFDQLGESVADKWTKEEQRTYETLVSLNPPSRGKNFWDELPEAFPGKTMKELVSYYFNVFVLKRRAIQNRLDAQHVDSDDDETIYPECDSEDSDDYESGDERDEEEDHDASEDEDETDKEMDGPYGSDSSAKLLEDTGFCDLGGYSSKMEVISPLAEAQGVPMNVRTARLMNLEDVEDGYHDRHQEEIDDRLRAAHMTAEWSHVHIDEKHLEDDHTSMVGEEELQEVKTWEASHWDEADHDDDFVHDPEAKGISSKGEQIPERDSSILYKKAAHGTNQQISLVGSCEGEAWGPTMDVAPISKRDKLLSTNGMIQELFGNEASGLNASS